MIDIIKKTINSIEVKEDYLYLLYRLDNESGFFFHQEKLLFMRKTNDLDKNATKSYTEYLSFLPEVEITSVSNDATFKEGRYNLLYFNHDYNDERSELFVNLCDVYIKNNDKISLYDFFSMLKSMFYEKTENDFKNMMGLYGELSLIKKVYEEKKLNICGNWHINGKFSKYDFIFDELNIEVKTSLDKLEAFKIKHNQVFNDQNNYICTVMIEKNETGNTLSELVTELKLIDEIKQNLTFMIKLENELFKYKNIIQDKFWIVSVNFYNINDLSKVTDIPAEVSHLEYLYNFSSAKKTELNDIAII